MTVTTRQGRGAFRVFAGFRVRSTVLHTFTYVVIGAASYWLVARRYGYLLLAWERRVAHARR